MNNAIDGTYNVGFEYVFRGDRLSSYQVQILENNTNTVLYTGTKTDVSDVYNGDTVEFIIPSNTFTNGKYLIWNVTQWESLPSMFVAGGAIQSGSTTTSIKIRQHPNVKANMYLSINGVQRKITSYTYSTGTAVVSPAFLSAPTANAQYQIHTDFTTSPNFFFKSRTTPVITLGAIPDPIATRNHTFTATYAQAENVNIKYHTWELWHGEELLNTSGQIFSANLSFSFDGFIAGEEYSVLLKVVTQDDDVVIESTGIINIAYSTPDISVPPQIVYLPDKRGAQVSWKSDALAIPTVTGTYSYANNVPYTGTNSVYIQTGELIYDKISESPYEIASDEFSIFIDTKFDNDKQGEIISLDGISGNYTLRLDGYNFYIVKNGITTLVTTAYPTVTSGATTGAAEANKAYIWDDTDIWTDTKYWTETTTPLSNIRFKITVLPTAVQIARLV